MGVRPLAFDAVIFDIDNVLVDTRASYLDAIRWTVEIYLTSGTVPMFSKHHKSPEPFLLSEEDVESFKLLGGFNDDWDCCYGLLVYLLSLRFKARTLQDLKRLVDLRAFSKKVKPRPLRVSGMVKTVGSTNLVLIERIARIFQEVYLGKGLFETVEKRRNNYWKKTGLIKKEKLIFRKSLLQKLKDLGLKLGIATGRSRFEAVYALKRFEVAHFFDALTTIDEVKEAEQTQKQSLRKPHPFSILETAKKIGSHKRFLYVGDLPDDVMAAQTAKQTLEIKSVAFPFLSWDPQHTLKEIEKVGPDYILKKPADLLALVAPHKTARVLSKV